MFKIWRLQANVLVQKICPVKKSENNFFPKIGDGIPIKSPTLISIGTAQVGKFVLQYYTYFYLSECQYGHCLCGVFCGTTTNDTEALKQLTNQS